MCLAVVCELSNILAICLTLLAGNLLNSTCPSFKVFDTNDSSFKKNQKMSLWRICAVSGGYLASATYVCTALCHSSTLISVCLKLVSRSNLALNSFACGLQNSSNFSSISLLGSDLHWANSMRCIGLNQCHLTRLSPSYIFLFQTTCKFTF